MSTLPSDALGQLLCRARDLAIQASDRNLRSNSKSYIAERWREAGVQPSPEVAMVISDAVDEVLFQILCLMDSEELTVRITVDGESHQVDEDAIGELAGSYIGEESWRSKYSKQRWFPFSE